jgi:hypothetical protein
MTERDGERLIRRLYDEILNAGRLEVLPEVIAAEIEDFTSSRRGRRMKLAEVEKAIRGMRSGAPQLHFKLRKVVEAHQDTVVARCSVRGLLKQKALPHLFADSRGSEYYFRIDRGRIAAIWRAPPDYVEADYEPEDDDDGFGGPPPGPPWIPPLPKPIRGSQRPT